MKPILVQQDSNSTLWWVVDWRIAIRTPLPWGWGKKMHRVFTLIPADGSNARGTREDYDTYYTHISN